MTYNQNFRKFLSGTVTAAIVASAIAPVASAASFTDVNPNDSHAANINALVEKGYIKGFTDGTFKPYQNITRGQAAKIFARILTDNGFKAPEELEQVFSDVPLDHKDQELVKAAAIVKAAGVMTGSGGKLNADQPITRQQMAKVIVEAFDLTKSDDFTSKITDLDNADAYARDYIQTLEANGVTVVTEFNPKGNVTRAAFASFVKRAMDAQEAAKAPQVESVRAINAKQLVVKFNQAVDKTEAEKISYYKLEGEEFVSAVLSEDEKTVTLTTADELKVSNAKLTVLPVPTKADANVKTAEFNQLLTFADIVAPTVTSVEAKGTTAVITFAEPVQSAGTVSLNGVALTSGYTLEGNTLTITGLEAEKSYRVNIVGAKDFAGNIANPIALNFTVEKPAVDDIKPTVAVSVNGTMVTVDFSEELSKQDLNNDQTANEYAKVTVGTTEFLLTDAEKDASDKTKFTFDAKSVLGTKAFVNTTVKVKSYKDAAGNAGEAYSVGATLVADKTAPTLVSVSSKLLKEDDANSSADEDVVYVTFNEPVTVKGNLKLISKNGIVYTSGTTVAVDTTSGVDVDGNGKKEGSELNTIAIPVDLDKNSSYKFELAGKSVADLSGNTIDDALILSFTTADYQAPGYQPSATLELAAVNPVVVDSNNNNIFTVEYAADVTSSALNAANYTLGGKALPANTLLQFVDGTKKVQITLPEGSIEANGSYVLEIKNVVDTKGNTLKNGKASVLVPLLENVAPVASKVTVLDSDTFTVDFSEAIKDQATVTGVIVKINGVEVTPKSVTAANGKLTVVTNADYKLTDSISVEFKSANLVDVNGNKVKDGVVSN
jgi:hypothetical protein